MNVLGDGGRSKAAQCGATPVKFARRWLGRKKAQEDNKRETKDNEVIALRGGQVRRLTDRFWSFCEKKHRPSHCATALTLRAERSLSLSFVSLLLSFQAFFIPGQYRCPEPRT